MRVVIGIVAIASGLAGCAAAPETSCTSLWPELPQLLPGMTLRADFEAEYGPADTAVAMPEALTPGGQADSSAMLSAYTFPAGSVQVFFDEGRLATAIVTPSVRFPTDSMLQSFGPPDSLAAMVSLEGVAFEQLFWWSDRNRVLRVAVSWEGSVRTLFCGRLELPVNLRA